MSNISNVLSVHISRCVSIKTPNDEYPVVIYDHSVLNFSLKTGEQITLADLFADNCDYKKLINDQINKHLFSENIDGGDEYRGMDFGVLRVISPFNGINDDQKFYLSEDNIMIILDYENPEFDTNNYGYHFLIRTAKPEIAKNFALFSRFETNDESLYDGSVNREKSLRNLTHDLKTDIIMYGKAADLGLDYADVDGMYFNVSIPKEIKTQALYDRFNKEYSEARDNFSNYIAEKKKTYPDYKMAASYNYYVQEIAKYYIEEKTASVQIFAGIEEDNNYFFTTQVAVYDKTTGEKLSVKECFKDGFDYKKAIIDIVKEENKENIYWELTEKDVADIIESGGFKLGISEMEFSDSGNQNQGYNRRFYVSYKDLGYENLAIFD